MGLNSLAYYRLLVVDLLWRKYLLCPRGK